MDSGAVWHYYRQADNVPLYHIHQSVLGQRLIRMYDDDNSPMRLDMALCSEGKFLSSLV